MAARARGTPTETPTIVGVWLSSSESAAAVAVAETVGEVGAPAGMIGVGYPSESGVIEVSFEVTPEVRLSAI